MKIHCGMYVIAVALMTLVLVAEATLDMHRLLSIDRQYEMEKESDMRNEWRDLPFLKRGVGTQKFISCFHPGLNTRCFCDRTKPKYSRNYFYYCRGAGRRNIRPY